MENHLDNDVLNNVARNDSLDDDIQNANHTNCLPSANDNWKIPFSFDNFTFLFLFAIFLPSFIRIILFIILIITNQKDKNIKTRKELHIFYDYELYLDFVRKYDYKLFRYHDAIFGLMEAHIRSYIRCYDVDLHRYYPNHPRVVNWRKRGYERDFEFCVDEMNDVYQEHNVVYIYNFENIKEYGFKYHNY